MNRRIFEPLSLYVVIALVILLQVVHLSLATNPITDEGVYAEAGRLIMQGNIPHMDFPLWHMPMLPLLIGIGLKLFGSMYPIRLIYLLLNCLAAIPLYLTFRNLHKYSAAAVLAIFFYLTFHEMVHHDFRFLAVRQLTNIFFIGFFYLGTVKQQWKWTPLLQTLCAAAAVMTFLLSAVHLVLLVIALVLMANSWKESLSIARRYTLIAIPVLVLLLVYFLFIPQSIDQVIVAQTHRFPMDLQYRLKLMFTGQFDAFFYTVSLVSLVLGTVFLRKQRFLCFAMLGIFLTSTFLPRFFYPHYTSAAAPALAYGIFIFSILVSTTCKHIGQHALLCTYTILIFTFTYHFSLVFSSLAGEWLGNRNPDYYQLIDVLRNSPGPLLALEPIYAVDADRQLIHESIDTYFRSPLLQPLSENEYAEMANRACTILLEGKANRYIPSSLRKQWREQFAVIHENRWGSVLLTSNAHCTQPLLEIEQQ